MRYLGKIIRWNDERGFGFIQSLQDDKEYFVHISEFMIQQPRPQEDEEVSFKIIKGNQGKTAAGAVEYINRPKVHKNERYEKKVSSGSGGVMLPLLLIIGLVIGLAGYFGFQQWQRNKVISEAKMNAVSVAEVAEKMKQQRQQEKIKGQRPQEVVQVPPSAVEAANERAKNIKLIEQPSLRYQCDGRKYCSQMTSCEEAMFFLQNCPGVKMDGDHRGGGDGIPCERQWCGHLKM